jgi:hypothetical protein
MQLQCHCTYNPAWTYNTTIMHCIEIANGTRPGAVTDQLFPTRDFPTRNRRRPTGKAGPCGARATSRTPGMAWPGPRAARPPSEYRAPAALQGCASRCDGLRFYRGRSDCGVKCSTWVGRIPPPAGRRRPAGPRPFTALQGRGAGRGFNTRVRPTPP